MYMYVYHWRIFSILKGGYNVYVGVSFLSEGGLHDKLAEKKITNLRIACYCNNVRIAMHTRGIHVPLMQRSMNVSLSGPLLKINSNISQRPIADSQLIMAHSDNIIVTQSGG